MNTTTTTVLTKLEMDIYSQIENRGYIYFGRLLVNNDPTSITADRFKELAIAFANLANSPYCDLVITKHGRIGIRTNEKDARTGGRWDVKKGSLKL